MGASIYKLLGCSPQQKECSNNIHDIEQKEIIQIIKIHICGYGERKKKVINLLFKNKITKSDLKK